MRIYVSHSTNFDFKNELYIPLRTATLNSEHQITLPHETNQFINSKRTIIQSDLVIAEASYPSIGQGIELGWANDAQIPIICVYKEGSKISSSLKSVCTNFVSYVNNEDLIKKVRASLLAVKDENHVV